MSQTAERHLIDMLEEFDTAMLITHGAYGTLNARPMRVAEISDAGELYFVTAASSSKVKEIQNDSDVTLIFQNQKTFVSLNGKASIITDRDRVEKLWSEAWRLWFPKGKTDESIRLLKIAPVDAEYWDNSGIQAISYAFEAAKAYIKGVPPASSEKQHGKIAM